MSTAASSSFRSSGMRVLAVSPPSNLSPDIIGMAVGQHERDAPGRLGRSIGSGPVRAAGTQRVG